MVAADGEFLAVGDGKGAVTVHSIRSGFTKRVVLGGQGGGSVGRVSAVDFSVDGRWLRVETVEKTAQGPVHHLGYWDVGQQQRANGDGEGGALDLRDEQWASYNSTVGWSVMGVWHGEDSDGVQSLDVAATWSSGGSVTAAASGSAVKLYRYPAIEKRPTARTLLGTAVRCVACGLRMTVAASFLWHHVPICPAHEPGVTPASWQVLERGCVDAEA